MAGRRSSHYTAQAISPEPSSFNKCLPVQNNAGLAFDATYTRHYPLLYELFWARGQDPRATIEAIKQAADTYFLTEEAVVDYFRNLIRQRTPQ